LSNTTFLKPGRSINERKSCSSLSDRLWNVLFLFLGREATKEEGSVTMLWQILGIVVFAVIVYILLCGQNRWHRGTWVEKANLFLQGGCFIWLG